LIPAAEWRGRGWWPADATDEKVTVDHLLRAISSLPCLTDLTIDTDIKVLVPATFPRSLCKLKTATYGSVSVLLSAGPHSQIKELEISASHVQAAVRACPEITALTVRDYHTQEDLDIILGTCKNLQRLRICAGLLSFSILESSLCARSLTSIKVIARLAPGSMEVICRCCPAIEELSVYGVDLADVRAMASLMRLHVLKVTYGHKREQGPELAEAFTALGNADGATSFTRLVLRYVMFDVTGLFSSRRCSALRELKLVCCNGLTEQAMQALATNVRDSLTMLMFSVMLAEPIIPLLAECHRLECLILRDCIIEDMLIISQICKAPLRFVKIIGQFRDNGRITNGEVRAIVPALAGVVFLRIECPAKVVLRHIIPRCPCLQMLRVSSSYAKRLRSVVPKHITIIP
jgi:hypothetical protein